jgi:hypothetical protein
MRLRFPLTPPPRRPFARKPMEGYSIGFLKTGFVKRTDIFG